MSKYMFIVYTLSDEVDLGFYYITPDTLPQAAGWIDAIFKDPNTFRIFQVLPNSDLLAIRREDPILRCLESN